MGGALGVGPSIVVVENIEPLATTGIPVGAGHAVRGLDFGSGRGTRRWQNVKAPRLKLNDGPAHETASKQRQVTRRTGQA